MNPRNIVAAHQPERCTLYIGRSAYAGSYTQYFAVRRNVDYGPVLLVPCLHCAKAWAQENMAARGAAYVIEAVESDALSGGGFFAATEGVVRDPDHNPAVSALHKANGDAQGRLVADVKDGHHDLEPGAGAAGSSTV